jgi:hypothetical protein
LVAAVHAVEITNRQRTAVDRPPCWGTVDGARASKYMHMDETRISI